MKNTAIVGGLVLALMGGRVPSQEPVRADLARAVVIEEEERDLARAAAEYRRIAAEAKDAELRGEAGVRLGSALLAMGKKDEARAVLEPLAAAGGGIGERARLLLQDQGQDDPVFAARVRAALALTRQDPEKGKAELTFLGRGVVPHLMQAIGERSAGPGPQPVDRAFLAAVVDVMCELGGPDAAGGLHALAKHPDVVVRRTCAEQFNASLSGDLVPVAHEFLSDPDASVRLAAAGQLGRRLRTEAKLRLMGDPDAAVRETAFSIGSGLDWTELPDGTRTALADAVRAELARESPVATLAQTVAGNNSQATSEGRSLWLALLRHPGVQRMRHQNWNNVQSMPRNAHADELVATAEVLAERGDREGLSAIRLCVHTAATGWWDGSVLPQVLRLARLGVTIDPGWIARVAQPQDVPSILQHVDVLDLDNQLGPWLLRQSLPAGAWKPLAAALEARPARAGVPSWLGSLLMRTRADEAVPVLVARAVEPNAYNEVARLLSGGEEPTTAMVQGMVTLLGRSFGPDDARATGARNLLFVAVAWEGKDELIQPLAASYRLGLSHSQPRRGNSIRGIECLQQIAGLPDSVGPAFAGALVDACLSAGSAEAFQDAKKLVQGSVPPAPEVYAAIGRHALSAPDDLDKSLVNGLLFRSHIHPAAAEALYLAALASSDGVVVTEAIRSMRAPIPRDAVSVLATRARERGDTDAIIALGHSGDAGQVLLLRQLLRDEREPVRASAMSALAWLQGNDAVDALLPLAADPGYAVRQQFCSTATRLLDRRFAPALLKLLRDESQQIREAAQKALEAIEFFHAQTARWQRILSDANLDAPSAAEALVKQATTGKDPEIRLAAIASLGTLAVPETLPVLIQLIQDADPKIAAAARAAIAKINAK